MRALVIAVLLLLSAHEAFPQTITPRSVESQHIAAIVGFTRVAAGTDGADGTDGVAAVERQRQIERVVACLLDADIAIAGINNEISDLQHEQARLQSRSDSRSRS